MNNKKQITQEVNGDKKISSRGFHKRNLSRKLSKPRRLLWADDITEVLGGGSSNWVSPISSTPIVSDKKIKGILKKPCSSKQVALGL